MLGRVSKSDLLWNLEFKRYSRFHYSVSYFMLMFAFKRLYKVFDGILLLFTIDGGYGLSLLFWEQMP